MIKCMKKTLPVCSIIPYMAFITSTSTFLYFIFFHGVHKTGFSKKHFIVTSYCAMIVARGARKGVKMSILKAPNDVKSIELFSKNLSFPVFVFPCSEWEQTQVSYLHKMIPEQKFTTFLVCKWCQNHRIGYQILFPSILSLLKQPDRLMCYLYLKSNNL